MGNTKFPTDLRILESLFIHKLKPKLLKKIDTKKSIRYNVIKTELNIMQLYGAYQVEYHSFTDEFIYHGRVNTNYCKIIMIIIFKMRYFSHRQCTKRQSGYKKKHF